VKAVIATMWICAAALYLCATGCAWLAVTAPDLARALPIGALGVVQLALAYCLTSHAWTLTLRCRDAVLAALGATSGPSREPTR